MHRSVRLLATISSGKNLSKGGKGPVLTLEHFVQRSRVLALWRGVVRTIYQIPPTSPTRAELLTYARGEFERRRAVHDLAHIRFLISTGKTQLESLRGNIGQHVR
ncbi:hypothetical protein LTR53_014700 [Teratosphaeriaceae sp. CCFEE 6253]|nr:hypothetical protein LTR53_014700 [Teratosphaeriaceae sp. CCFEE 6253]